MNREPAARFVARWEVGSVTGAVVVIDVIRAFTTAAYAFASGARHIFLVSGVDEARAFKDANPGVLAMGEDGGLRPEGFDFPNSPVALAEADLHGRILVQRTSAGTQGVVAARNADRIWCGSLVVASATAVAVRASGLGTPTYVITGRFPDRPELLASDDRAAAHFIEEIRLGHDPDRLAVAARVASSDEAIRTLTLGPEHVHADDVVLATRVDAFDFAMQVTRIGGALRLDRVEPSPTG